MAFSGVFMKNKSLVFSSRHFFNVHLQFSSVAQSCPTLCNSWTAAHQASLSITNSQSVLKLIIKSVMPSTHLILCHPLLLLPSIFPASGYKYLQRSSNKSTVNPCEPAVAESTHHPGFTIPASIALLSLLFEFLFIGLLLENFEANIRTYVISPLDFFFLNIYILLKCS